MSKSKPIRKRLVAIIKFKSNKNSIGKPSISDGAPMPGGRIMRPDGTIERHR